MKSTRVPLLEAVRDVSGGNSRIPQSAFEEAGPLAIVDQGQGLIAGYTHDLSAQVATPSPVIVFGDHTRALKYVDFPFAMGADGVKVLKPREDFDPRFVYHYLQSHKLPSAGYSRHFKFLKELDVPKSSLDEQRRIAAILDHADAIRTKRRQALVHLDTLAQSIFHTMFGDLPLGESTVGDAGMVQGGLQVSSKRSSLPIAVPYLRVANVHRGRLDLTEIKRLRATSREIERTILVSGDLLVVEGHANLLEIGRVAVWAGEVEGCVHQNHLIRIRLDERTALPSFASHWLNSERGAAHFRRAGRTTSGLNTISTSTVRSAPLPTAPIELQHEFTARIAGVTARRAAVERALAADGELFASLQSRAFRGEL